MTAIREYAIETLKHAFIDRINFCYGGLRVYPDGLRELVRALRNGRIRIQAVALQPGRGAEYFPETLPGGTHALSVSTEFVEFNREGTVRTLSPDRDAILRMAIVHEMTHALQDYQRASTTTPQMAEGAAYVAGWMAAWLWGYRPTTPMEGHHTFAKLIAESILVGRTGYHVPDEDVQHLNRVVPINRRGAYVFNGL